MLNLFKDKAVKRKLLSLITGAKYLGLSDSDCEVASEYLEVNEWGLCFDHIITQIYEFDIAIDTGFYDLIVDIGNDLELKDEDYSFIQSLIKG